MTISKTKKRFLTEAGAGGAAVLVEVVSEAIALAMY